MLQIQELHTPKAKKRETWEGCKNRKLTELFETLMSMKPRCNQVRKRLMGIGVGTTHY
ncbi:hypothetical protein L208DRAFT_1394371 [Tricholoma matsutake]|nr:hypothetical protein L208DRAFT_1415089 [Tricholoma matsutake 945]KAF8234320.1 hypothetical protein L208DRAFT_1394371 [Tricholoma matsutake 945]